MGNTEYVDRYRLATKPIKVVHFSADDKRQWDMFANGNNDCGVPFINDRLKNLTPRQIRYDGIHYKNFPAQCYAEAIAANIRNHNDEI